MSLELMVQHDVQQLSQQTLSSDLEIAKSSHYPVIFDLVSSHFRVLDLVS